MPKASILRCQLFFTVNLSRKEHHVIRPTALSPHKDAVILRLPFRGDGADAVGDADLALSWLPV